MISDGDFRTVVSRRLAASFAAAIVMALLTAGGARADDDDDDDDDKGPTASMTVDTWPPIDIAWPPELNDPAHAEEQAPNQPIVLPARAPLPLLPPVPGQGAAPTGSAPIVPVPEPGP